MMTELSGTGMGSLAARASWLAVLARASHAELAQRLAGTEALPAHTRLRGPESGLVMARGRAGGTGAPFNLGEVAVTRCTVRDAAGHVGHAYALGRDLAQAELAARLDAALQDADRREALMATVIRPLAETQRARREQSARHAAATRVEFFNMVNMR
jgi:alpha-D-ribose 1-methylphosphonate 5-triphosphate synthase subunit PhnG